MALFQNAVLQKHLKLQNTVQLDKAYSKFCKYFQDRAIQKNIRESKEEQFQEGFLRELFVNILGYTLNPQPNFNLTTELKNEKNAKKTDGAILKDGNALAVIELKSTKTKDLGLVQEQAFNYKANQTGCIYVITSNFEKLRFYINNAVDFEAFNLFTLSREQFAVMYLCLHKDNLLSNVALTIKNDSLVEEEKITKDFYKDYSLFKRELYRDLVKQNVKNEVFRSELEREDSERGTKNIKLNLFKKSQKLIDRFLFIFFAEDRGLLSPNSTLKILEKWNKLEELDAYKPLYDIFQQYFNYLDTGRTGTDKKAEIFAYNGGLFKPDTVLDSLLIDDKLLYKHAKTLSHYDFDSQVDVNILGHIFENSLNEIESVNAEIEGGDFDKQKTKRKKDGVFYTPKYITKYIVDNTVGKLCKEKRTELGIVEEDYIDSKQKKTKEKLLKNLKAYRDWLLQITICDPACGSGAFLNQALDFLIYEHSNIDTLEMSLLGGSITYPNIENTVLENNIFGVDLNEESVEIAKLSLWLRTAQPRRKLNDLNSNIQCGNSLIDNKAVAGDKAFNWQESFPKVFAKGGFDVVIGNPPWGAKIPENDLKLIKSKHKDIIVRMVDSFMFFMDKSIDFINNQGVIGMIIPDVILYQTDNSKLRERILNETYLNYAINVGDGIFEEVARPSAIVIYSKFNFKKPTIVGNFNKNKDSDIYTINTYNVKKELFYSIPNTVFATQNLKGYEILKRHNKNTLDDFVDKDGIQRGVSPDLKEAFIVGNKTIISENLEKEYIKKTVTGGVDVKRYYNIEVDKNLFYITKNDNPDNFINIHKYIEQFLPKITCKEVKQGKHPFYTLHRARNRNIFEKNNKVLGVITGDSIITSVDEKKLYPTDGLYVFNSNKNATNKYLSTVLNSKLSTYLYRLLSSETGRTLAQVKPVLLSQLPFIKPSIENIKNIEFFYDKISLIIQTFTKVQGDFLKYLSQLFKISKFTRKLDNWYTLDFGDFIKELNKAIKAVNKERVKEELTPIATLTKLDEMEWMEVFETKKAEAQALKTQIDQTDKEIDQMVYELYGLTDEEIEIVENS